jgi:hypothetical protein
MPLQINFISSRFSDDSSIRTRIIAGHASTLAGAVRPELIRRPSPSNRGSRGYRVRAAPAVSCANCAKKTHTSIQVQRKHSGIPRAMALRLMA